MGYKSRVTWHMLGHTGCLQWLEGSLQSQWSAAASRRSGADLSQSACFNGCLELSAKPHRQSAIVLHGRNLKQLWLVRMLCVHMPECTVLLWWYCCFIHSASLSLHVSLLSLSSPPLSLPRFSYSPFLSHPCLLPPSNPRVQWLRGKASDSRLREPGFQSCAPVLKPWASFFTLHCSSSFSSINEYLAIDSGEYVYEQPSRINCSIWLDVCQRSRDGV